jgi:hypothetical protein
VKHFPKPSYSDLKRLPQAKPMRLSGAGSLRPNLCGVVGREISDVRLRKILGIPSRFLSEIVF